MANTNIDLACEEISRTKIECLQLIDTIMAICPPDEHGDHPPTFRLVVSPMLYSAWERSFTFCNAITLRLVRDTCVSASTLSAASRALWLQRTSSYQKFVGQLTGGSTESIYAGIPKPKRGRFTALSEFLETLDLWLSGPLDSTIDTQELVMTFSNVNPEVVRLNARAVGIDSHATFSQIDLTRLDELVGIRNGIGHGSSISPIGNRNFIELQDYTKQLIEKYCDSFVAWITDKWG